MKLGKHENLHTQCFTHICIYWQVLERKAKAFQQMGNCCKDEIVQLSHLLEKVSYFEPNIFLEKDKLSWRAAFHSFFQGLVPDDKIKALNATLLQLNKFAAKENKKLTESKTTQTVLAESVKICETLEQGRYLVASRDIAVGEQVGGEKVFCHV